MIVAGQVRKREREALVGGQRSLEFHTWINSPSSGVYSTSSSNFLSFLALVRSFPPPSRAPEAFATRIPRSTLVQPLMNVRAACDITPDTPFRYPLPSRLPLPPHAHTSSIRYTVQESAWQRGTWTMKSRTPERCAKGEDGGDGGGGGEGWCRRILPRALLLIVLNLLRPELFTLGASLAANCVHRSRNSSWLQIKPSVKYYRLWILPPPARQPPLCRFSRT